MQRTFLHIWRREPLEFDGIDAIRPRPRGVGPPLTDFITWARTGSPAASFACGHHAGRSHVLRR